MKTKQITFFGKQVILACDGNCNKAWGISCRHRMQLSDDIDDYCFAGDSELGDAPRDPGTYEGGQAKPTNREFNKWCARECERSKICNLGEKITLNDFSNRVYNKKSKAMQSLTESSWKES